jgi:hypothetical protein
VNVKLKQGLRVRLYRDKQLVNLANLPRQARFSTEAMAYLQDVQLRLAHKLVSYLDVRDLGDDQLDTLISTAAIAALPLDADYALRTFVTLGCWSHVTLNDLHMAESKITFLQGFIKRVGVRLGYELIDEWKSGWWGP